MAVADSLSEAKSEAPGHGHCVIYSYRGSLTLTDERHEWTDPNLLKAGPS